MNFVEELILNFQNLVAQVPETLQPFIIMLAGAIPSVEGEIAAMIGVAAGVNPIVAGAAGAIGNFLTVLIIIVLTSNARTAVERRRKNRAQARAGALVSVGPSATAGAEEFEELEEAALAQPESKGRLRFRRWLVRYGVPGASIIGPLAIPTQVMSAVLVAGGTPRGWVLLWQTVSIVVWTTAGTVSVWAALTFLVGV